MESTWGLLFCLCLSAYSQVWLVVLMSTRTVSFRLVARYGIDKDKCRCHYQIGLRESCWRGETRSGSGCWRPDWNSDIVVSVANDKIIHELLAFGCVRDVTAVCTYLFVVTWLLMGLEIDVDTLYRAISPGSCVVNGACFASTYVTSWFLIHCFNSLSSLTGNDGRSQLSKSANHLYYF